MKKKWVLKQIDEKLIPKVPDYPALILRLLAARGFTEEKEIQNFLNPEYSNLIDPYKFKDMKKSVDRIQQSIEKGERIVVYADYDADAITACAVVYLALKKLGAEVGYYIPDRFSEGYGVNSDAIKQIASESTKLIITVDCGTNSVAETKIALDLGVDVIITDHHEIVGERPKSFALINPKNSEDNYPYKYLTGVGVAYKLVQALMPDDEWHKWLLDLVSIGTVADLQKLDGENRILVKFGLHVLEKTRWSGLKALIDVSGARFPMDTYTLGFLIAPRINAAGRIRHADLAFRLLITDQKKEAEDLAKQLDDLNQHRQMLTDQTLSEAREQAERISDKPVLVVSGDDWPKGVVGLVAGRLMEEYNRPVLVIDSSGDEATGSARSVNNFDIVGALNKSANLLTKYGGHKQAAGFSLKPENIEALHQRLLEIAKSLDYEPTDPEITIDSEVGVRDLSWEIYEYLTKLAPFGVGNRKPKFLAKNFEVIQIRQVGADNQHLKLTCQLEGKQFNAIAFGKGFLAAILSSNKKFDAVFELEANEWNGNKELQLKILDIKIQE
ncbi:MAG: single-stranded-DNA-specific exonuclease RecJ [bacterium]|nr:single-stranded-DNA-specific exonuclease RecJ [bacterium]